MRLLVALHRACQNGRPLISSLAQHLLDPGLLDDFARGPSYGADGWLPDGKTGRSASMLRRCCCSIHESISRALPSWMLTTLIRFLADSAVMCSKSIGRRQETNGLPFRSVPCHGSKRTSLGNARGANGRGGQRSISSCEHSVGTTVVPSNLIRVVLVTMSSNRSKPTSLHSGTVQA